MAWFSKKEKVPKLELSKRPPRQSLQESKYGSEILRDKENFSPKPRTLPQPPQEPQPPPQPLSKPSQELPNQSDSVSYESPAVSGEKEVLQELPKDFHFTNQVPSHDEEMTISKFPPKMPEPQAEPEIPTPKFSTPMPPAKKVLTKSSSEPVFVKISKFQTASRDLEAVKTSLAEVESTLKEFKQVKLKEDKEVELWTQQIEAVKEKLSSIDSLIFNKI